MRKLTSGLIIALLTFLVGIMVTVTSPIDHPSDKGKANPAQSVAELTLTRNVPKEWKKIDAGGGVSFYLPPNMKKTGLPGNEGVVAALEGHTPNGKGLYLYYAYGERVPNDLNPFSDSSVEVFISGKKAKIHIWQYDRGEMLSKPKLRPGMELLVPDIGDGKNKLEIYAASFDLEGIKQIFGSVEIR